jgi:hypothetical protein
MSEALVPCPTCQRHVRASDACCPFCGCGPSSKAKPLAAAALAAGLALSGCPNLLPAYGGPAAVYGGPPAKNVGPTSSATSTAPTTSTSPAPVDTSSMPAPAYGAPPSKGDDSKDDKGQ